MQRDGYIYWTFNDGTHNHAVFYRVRVIDTTINTAPLGERSKWELFFDPNTLSKNGQVSVHNYSWSHSGQYFSYTISSEGYDTIFKIFKFTLSNNIICNTSRNARKIVIMNSYTKETLESLQGCAIAQSLKWYKDEVK